MDFATGIKDALCLWDTLKVVSLAGFILAADP
jgi:hypothetical protein